MQRVWRQWPLPAREAEEPVQRLSTLEAASTRKSSSIIYTNYISLGCRSLSLAGVQQVLVWQLCDDSLQCSQPGDHRVKPSGSASTELSELQVGVWPLMAMHSVTTVVAESGNIRPLGWST